MIIQRIEIPIAKIVNGALLNAETKFPAPKNFHYVLDDIRLNTCTQILTVDLALLELKDEDAKN